MKKFNAESQTKRENPDIMRMEKYDKACEQPAPERLLLREAVKHLKLSQIKVWELWNYDRFTQVEIGKKLRITQQAVGQRIATIEKAIARYCKEHKEVYKAIKEAGENL